jgi:phosphoribosylanthranilate isomerase
MRVKICGLRSRAEAAAATDAGAAYVGFVHYPPSPRHMSVGDLRWVAGSVPGGVIRVVLTVDASDEVLDELMAAAPVDMLQLHGRESPERTAELRARYGRPVMKAIGIAEEPDLAQLDCYAEVSDQILIDARPPRGADRPGGHGVAFDWRLIRGRRWRLPWMLAGGLTPENVAEAIRLTGAEQVDVSSGVERSPGYKDPERIRAFLLNATAAPEAALS